MRVALLSSSAKTADAIGNQLAEKVAFFSDHGADVRVFVECDQRLHPAVRPHCQKMDQPLFRGAAWQFLCSADLVIADYSQHYSLLELLPLLAEGKPRIILDYHGVTPVELWGTENREALERGAQERGLVWCADAAIVHSRFTGLELTRPTGFPHERMHQLSLAIDTDQPPSVDPALLRRPGLEQATILLFVGRVAPNKRLPVLVEALAELRDLVPPVHAVVIGDMGGVYAAESQHCRQRAVELGVADRLHLLGQVNAAELRDAYHSADVFVMPSRHEGFCVPVVEAMACGLPVVAARAGALPETVGSAGLTFAPDDAEGLARQVRRVLDVRAWSVEREARSAHEESLGARRSALHAPRSPLHVAIVACRYGSDFAGGAETSLRTIAESLHRAGHRAEVFTTCSRDENHGHEALPPGSQTVDGIRVHRFRIDPRDPRRHDEAQRHIAEALEPIAPRTEQDFLTHSIRSTALVAALGERIADFDAIVVGPYLFGLTRDVARAFPDKTLLLPCFHDEPAARLPGLLDAYREVGGILYHSPEEQQLAEVELGLNHPGAVALGAWLDVDRTGAPRRGQALVADTRPYLLYAGRWSPHKELPLLLTHTKRYGSRHPDRFVFAFIGGGEVAIPEAPWARNLGFVNEATRRDLMAGAAAVVQLSRLESLSLVALQSWVEGVPVLVSSECAVLAAQVGRAGGGRAVGGHDAFDAALDDLWEQRPRWEEMGSRGRAYVRAQYGSRAAFTRSLEEAVRGLRAPLRAHMRRQGLLRAQAHGRSCWRQQFGRIVEEVVHAPPRPVRHEAIVEPRAETRSVGVGLESLLVPVRIHNRGTLPLIAEGPARTVLRCDVVDETGAAIGARMGDTPLPGLVLPGQVVPAAVTVSVPKSAGVYQVVCRAERALGQQPTGAASNAPAMRLVVEREGEGARTHWVSALAETVQQALAHAGDLQRLPDGYVDVTEGWLAEWKRRVKGKLLHNFKRAYVDVLARQQSAFNRQALTVLQELVECCATLEHAQQQAGTRAAPAAEAAPSIVQELEQSRQRCGELERRLARLEALLLGRGMIIT